MSETNSDAGIVVQNAARSFGEVHAVRDVSLEAKPGQVTGLIGPNGSGKTTLLLMLASLLVPDSGSIRIGGHDPVTESGEVRAIMGWMPDVLGSWASLSVRATLELTARLYRLDRQRAAARASELIALVDLEPLADRPTRVLSRGQKQRLSLARALVHDPRVLLLDEPASGLDPAARVALRRLVRTLADEGRTILISSHVLAELDEMADTAVYLDAGITASADAIAATRTSVRDWRVRSLAPDKLRAALVAAGVAAGSITEDGPGLLVPLEGDEAAAGLLGTLVRKKVPVTSFAPAVGDMEHTFLDLSEGNR
ncbi:MAG: transporter ATP-binding protein [Schumannella sp.]|nr:transporter ATP-binding protein [Schumannella sp.]